MNNKNDSENTESGCSRPVVVKKESKCKSERPFRCPEGGDKRDREESCSRGKYYQSKKNP